MIPKVSYTVITRQEAIKHPHNLKETEMNTREFDYTADRFDANAET